MNKARRLFLKFLGLVPAVVTLPSASEASRTKPELVLDKLDLKFYAYKSPKLVGWKGYWYKETPCVILPGTFTGRDSGSSSGLGHFALIYEKAIVGKDRVTHDIIAFETLDGKRVASPWVLQGESYHQARYRG